MNECPEPAPYRPAEQVIKEWMAHYACLFPGCVPSVRWLTEKTRLNKSVVYHHRGEVLSGWRKEQGKKH